MSKPETATEPAATTLRSVDWRFLLRGPEVPRAVDLRRGPASDSLELACETVPAAPGAAGLVVLGYPTRPTLRRAREVLRPDGEVVCLWQVPMPAGPQRARRLLEKAGLTDVRLLWPGPLPQRAADFWLPLDSPAAVDYVLRLRPPRSRAGAALRPVWRAAARGGLLAPLCAVARAPGADGAGDRIDAQLPTPTSWALLTAEYNAINVVGLPFPAGESEPAMVVKFARTAVGDAQLEREAEMLRRLERERPALTGAPRLVALGRRAGRRALAVSAVHGRPMTFELTPESFGELALRVTGWLVELAGREPVRPQAEWWPRLVGGYLERFERAFGEALEPGAGERVRELLEGLGDLPLAFEHREFAPGHVWIGEGGEIGAIDWEGAEPRGLPLCDLVTFLARAAFKLERSHLPREAQATYSRLLDPSTSFGRVAAGCTAEYSRLVGIPREAVPRLRLLCWVVQAVDLDAWLSVVGPVDGPTLLRAISLRLVDEELRRAEALR